MATLYYNAAVNTNWSTLGNWWTNEACSAPASSLPSSVDSVIILGNIESNSGSNPTVYHMTVSADVSNITIISVMGCEFYDSANYGGTITGNCTFYNTSKNTGTITGNCTFYDSSYNVYPGTITGNVTFNDNSGNGNSNDSITGGDIVGDVIFNDYSTHISSSYSIEARITGNVTYNDSAYRYLGVTYSNSVVFNDNSVTEGGSFYDIDGNSYNPNTFVIFNDSSWMLNTDVYLPVIMNDNSRIDYNSIGSETSVTLNDSAYVTGGGVGGFDIPWIFNNNSYITSSASILAYNDPPGNTLTFNHNSYNDGSIEANTVTFNDSSYNNGPITCTASTFKDSSYNSANGIITGDEVYNDRTPDPVPRGINGSSMLAMLN